MKKLILISLIFPALIYGQITKKTFIEWNLGVASVDVYDFSDLVFPGTSVLYVKTLSYDGGLVAEGQIGLNNEFSFESGLIATLGYRWQLKNRK